MGSMCFCDVCGTPEPINTGLDLNIIAIYKVSTDRTDWNKWFIRRELLSRQIDLCRDCFNNHLMNFEVLVLYCFDAENKSVRGVSFPDNIKKSSKARGGVYMFTQPGEEFKFFRESDLDIGGLKNEGGFVREDRY